MNTLVEIGKISSSFGLKGAFKVDYFTDSFQDFYDFKYIYVFGYKEKMKIEKIWNKKNSLYLKLEGIDSISLVDKIIGYSIYIDQEIEPELRKDTFYNRDLIGSKVLVEAKEIGTVVDVINGPSQDILVVSNGNDNAMIPFVKKFVLEVRLEDKIIIIDTIEGLIPWI